MKSINNIAQQNFHLLGNSFSKSDFDLFLNNINHQDTEITNDQKDYIKYRYNYNYGWLTLRKFNKSLTQN